VFGTYWSRSGEKMALAGMCMEFKRHTYLSVLNPLFYEILINPTSSLLLTPIKPTYYIGMEFKRRDEGTFILLVRASRSL
jgi:hypothetical protein